MWRVEDTRATRSAYFVPPLPPPPPPPGPSPFAGLGALFVTLGVLVVVGVGGALGWGAYPSRKSARGETKDDIADEHSKGSKKDDETDGENEPGKPATHLPILATDPARGGDDPIVTLVAFEDFQCPYCARAEATLAALQTEYGADLRIVWKDEPLSFHVAARPAAKLRPPPTSRCAR